jgi:hypothetical protein
MTSSFTFKVLAKASKRPELDMLARLSAHRAFCESQRHIVGCNVLPVVYGEVEMNVSEPQAFAQDLSAREAVAKAIAAMARVPPTTVSVKLSVPENARRLGDDDARRISVALALAGRVNADYTIYVPPDKNADGVLHSLQGVNNAMATTEMMKALQEGKLSRTYLVEVKKITVSAETLHRGPIANCAFVHKLALMVLFVPYVVELLA